MDSSRNTITSVLGMVYVEILYRLRTGNNIAGVLLGTVVAIKNSIIYLQYADGHTVNCIEGFLINFSSKTNVTFIILAALLLFVDAPFIDDYSFISIYRIKRRRWFYSNYLYIIIKNMLFYMWILICSIIPFFASGYAENKWSQTFLRMMNGYTKKMDTFYLSQINKNLSMLSPYKTLILTIVLCSMYTIFLAELLFSINMICKKIMLGTIIAGAIYILTLFLDMQGILLPAGFAKWSIFRNAVFPLGFTPSLSGYLFSILLFLLLNYIVFVFASTIYPYVEFKEENNEQ